MKKKKKRIMKQIKKKTIAKCSKRMSSSKEHE